MHAYGFFLVLLLLLAPAVVVLAEDSSSNDDDEIINEFGIKIVPTNRHHAGNPEFIVLIANAVSVTLHRKVFDHVSTTIALQSHDGNDFWLVIESDVLDPKSRYHSVGPMKCSGQGECPDFLPQVWERIVAGIKEGQTIVDLTPIFEKYAAVDPPKKEIPEELFNSLQKAWKRFPKDNRNAALQLCAMAKMAFNRMPYDDGADDEDYFLAKQVVFFTCDTLKSF